MNINIIIEAIIANPVSLFALGLVTGFFLRGILGFLFSGQSNGKKTSRYRSRKSETDANNRSAAVVVDFKEPATDWSENTVKKIVRQSSRYTRELNQMAENLQKVAE